MTSNTNRQVMQSADALYIEYSVKAAPVTTPRSTKDLKRDMEYFLEHYQVTFEAPEELASGQKVIRVQDSSGITVVDGVEGVSRITRFDLLEGRIGICKALAHGYARIALVDICDGNKIRDYHVKVEPL